ncbi:hypothetical protein M444_01265 [Streptomyces sp. Mg1]|nr:hypothetical protein M444_01265 [Streptomyces sp. Mg1]
MICRWSPDGMRHGASRRPWLKSVLALAVQQGADTARCSLNQATAGAGKPALWIVAATDFLDALCAIMPVRGHTGSFVHVCARRCAGAYPLVPRMADRQVGCREGRIASGES